MTVNRSAHTPGSTTPFKPFLHCSMSFAHDSFAAQEIDLVQVSGFSATCCRQRTLLSSHPLGSPSQDLRAHISTFDHSLKDSCISLPQRSYSSGFKTRPGSGSHSLRRMPCWESPGEIPHAICGLSGFALLGSRVQVCGGTISGSPTPCFEGTAVTFIARCFLRCLSSSPVPYSESSTPSSSTCRFKPSRRKVSSAPGFDNMSLERSSYVAAVTA